jgi:hypothetical protein
MVRHALRVTARRTRGAYVHPATHRASPHDNAGYPRMGERLRLRKGFNLSGYSSHARAILRGLQTHGMFVADNGGDGFVSVTPDSRLQGLEDLKRVRGADFEVVEMSGAAGQTEEGIEGTAQSTRLDFRRNPLPGPSLEHVRCLRRRTGRPPGRRPWRKACTPTPGIRPRRSGPGAASAPRTAESAPDSRPRGPGTG